MEKNMMKIWFNLMVGECFFHTDTIFLKRSLHNRNSWQPMRVVLLKVEFLN